MIDLQIEKYCENCSEFEVEQDKRTIRAIDIEGNIVRDETYHILSCEHAEKCKALKKYLKGGAE